MSPCDDRQESPGIWEEHGVRFAKTAADGALSIIESGTSWRCKTAAACMRIVDPRRCNLQPLPWGIVEVPLVT